MWGHAQWGACAPISAPGAAAPIHANFLLGSIETRLHNGQIFLFFFSQEKPEIHISVGDIS